MSPTPRDTGDPEDHGGSGSAPPRRRKRHELQKLLFTSSKISEDRQRRFWSFETLSRVLTRERILTALEIELSEEDFYRTRSYVYEIGPLYNNDADVARKGPFYRPPFGHKCCLRIFGILVIMSKVGDISHFINHGIDDDKLPLANLQGFFEGTSDDEEGEGEYGELIDLLDWAPSTVYQFNELQWQFSTPCFSLHRATGAIDYTFSRDTILPWIKVESKTDQGGFGTVQKVTIDPGSHEFRTMQASDYHSSISSPGFQSVAHPLQNPNSNSHYAIKSFDSSSKSAEEDFAREVEVLERFSDSASHIIRLLCTYQRDDTKCMIFPWAECNLYQYWRRYPDGLSEADLIKQRWISNQLVGLADALDSIHNLRDGVSWGIIRHGDIKPENILWLQSSENPEGYLVLSDFGLAKIHKNLTSERRSNTQPSGFTAAYRAPETDIADSPRSRSSDIWSFGCVLLEMVCWVLGGYKEVEKFSSVRNSGSGDNDFGAFFQTKTSASNTSFAVNSRATDVREPLDP